MVDLNTALLLTEVSLAVAIAIPTIYYFRLMQRAGIIEALRDTAERRDAAKRKRIRPPNVEIAVVEE